MVPHVFSNNNIYLNGPIFFSDQTLLLLVLGSWLLYFSPLQRSDASGVHCIKSLSGAAQSISPNQAQQHAVVTNFFCVLQEPIIGVMHTRALITVIWAWCGLQKMQ